MFTRKEALFFGVFLSLVLSACSVSKNLNRGKVVPANFYTKITFETAKSLVLVPFELEGKIRNFLFDTGATVTAVQRDTIKGEVIEVRGAANKVALNGSEIITSLKIGEMDFRNTFATNEDMVGLKEQVPNFGGVLGRSIINKANWLIDYPNRTLEISSRDLSDDTFTDILLDKSEAAPHTTIQIDGKQYKAIIDLGSTSIFNVPMETTLAKELLANYSFEAKSRDRYTTGGGRETITEQVGFISLLKLGDLEFKDIRVNISQSSQIRLGMRFFENSILYIDNQNRRYRIK